MVEYVETREEGAQVVKGGQPVVLEGDDSSARDQLADLLDFVADAVGVEMD